MREFTPKNAVFLIALIALTRVNCDIPVHCLKHQVAGEWNFQLTKMRQAGTYFDHKCGHELPDNPETSNKAMEFGFISDSHVNYVLNEDATVGQKSGSSSWGAQWTMIYDEGF